MVPGKFSLKVPLSVPNILYSNVQYIKYCTDTTAMLIHTVLDNTILYRTVPYSTVQIKIEYLHHRGC